MHYSFKNYLVEELSDRYLVGLRIRNTENVQDNVFDIGFRRRDQLKPDFVWNNFPRSSRTMLALVWLTVWKYI